MAESTGKLVDRVREKVRSIKGRLAQGRSIPPPAEMRQRLHEQMSQGIHWVFARLEHDDFFRRCNFDRSDIEQRRNALFNEWMQAQSQSKLQPSSEYEEGYRRLYTQHHDLFNELKQERLHDWGEKARALLFRMLTGVGVAAIVLATGYLAQLWQIPIPLLRVIP